MAFDRDHLIKYEKKDYLRQEFIYGNKRGNLKFGKKKWKEPSLGPINGFILACDIVNFCSVCMDTWRPFTSSFPHIAQHLSDDYRATFENTTIINNRDESLNQTAKDSWYFPIRL